MYIEPLVSWPLPAFVELSESFEVQGQTIENENFEAWHQVSTIGERLEEVMYNPRWVVFPTPTITYIVITNFEEIEVEEANPITIQQVEFEQPASFSSQLI